MKNKKKSSGKFQYEIISSAKMPAGVQELMKVYDRFQEAYAATEKYLDLVSPRMQQSNSNQSIVKGGQ